MSESIEKGLQECLFFSAKKLDRALQKIADDAFAPTGMAPNYGFILLILEEHDGLQQKDIARLLDIAPSTIARFLEKLVQQKLIRSVVDGRKCLTFLTEAGRQKAQIVRKSWDDLHATYTQILGETESCELAAELNRMTGKISAK